MDNAEEIMKQIDTPTDLELALDFKRFWRSIIKNWKTILKWSLISSVIGILLGFSIPKEFTSKTVVAPELTTKGTSGMSSLANLAGINLSAMAVTDAMHTDLYPSILKSSQFLSEMFSMPVDFLWKGEMIHTDLYDYMLNYQKRPWWGYIFGLPHTMFDWIKNIFAKDTVDVEGYAELDQTDLTRDQLHVIKSLSESIKCAVDKKTYSVIISTTTQDARTSAKLANELVSHLETFVQEYRTEKARNNLAYYEKVCEEAKNEYYAAQKKYALYADANQGIIRQSVLVEKERLQAESQRLYQAYNQLRQQVLTGRAKVEEEAPVLVIIQPGVRSIYGKPSKVKLGAIFFILGAIAATIAIYSRKKEKNEN